jgi:hypothetical protein
LTHVCGDEGICESPANALTFVNNSSPGTGPVIALVFKLRVVNLVNFPICGGIEPVRLLSFMANHARLVKLPIDVGIVPTILLTFSRTLINADILLNSDGSSPVRLFRLAPREASLERFPNDVGRVPAKLPPAKFKFSKVVIEPSCGGIVPDNLNKLIRYSSFNFCSPASSVGIVPVILLAYLNFR